MTDLSGPRRSWQASIIFAIIVLIVVALVSAAGDNSDEQPGRLDSDTTVVTL